MAAWIIGLFFAGVLFFVWLPLLRGANRRANAADDRSQHSRRESYCSCCKQPCEPKDEFCARCMTCDRCGAQKKIYKKIYRGHYRAWPFCPNCEGEYCPHCECKQPVDIQYNDEEGDRSSHWYTCGICGKTWTPTKPSAGDTLRCAATPKENPLSRAATPQEYYQAIQAAASKKKDDAIVAAASRGDRVLAMKLYRETYGGSLADAKKFVDGILH